MSRNDPIRVQNTHPPVFDSAKHAPAVMQACRAILDRVHPEPIGVIDVGTNIGVWAQSFSDLGCYVVGVDSPYMEEHFVPRKNLNPIFVAADLQEPLQLHQDFDLAVCLEVAEHLPEECADVIVESLCRHAPVVCFSAAVPGQGGHEHINEQPISYWIGKFAANGYDADTGIRAALPSGLPVYYRENMVMFTRQRGG